MVRCAITCRFSAPIELPALKKDDCAFRQQYGARQGLVQLVVMPADICPSVAIWSWNRSSRVPRSASSRAASAISASSCGSPRRGVGSLRDLAPSRRGGPAAARCARHLPAPSCAVLPEVQHHVPSARRSAWSMRALARGGSRRRQLGQHDQPQSVPPRRCRAPGSRTGCRAVVVVDRRDLHSPSRRRTRAAPSTQGRSRPPRVLPGLGQAPIVSLDRARRSGTFQPAPSQKITPLPSTTAIFSRRGPMRGRASRLTFTATTPSVRPWRTIRAEV